MARNVKFEIRRGAGSSLEVLFGKVSLSPSMLHTVANSVVLPAPSTFDLVNGVAIATNVAPSPDPVEGQVPWAYRVKIADNHGKTFEYLVGVPDGTSEINFNVLPRYFETKPPLFGQGEQGIPGSAATIAIGTVDSGPTPTVTNTGTNTEAVLNFTLQEGPQGPPGGGVAFKDSLFSDLPNSYATGVTVGNASTTTGWPESFVLVITEKRFNGRTVQRLVDVNNSYIQQRTELGGSGVNTWSAIKAVAWDTEATASLKGLMPALDKAKLDGMTPAANSKTFAAAASTYQTGFSTLQVRVNEGWPLTTTGTLVTNKTASGNSTVVQWLYAVEGTPPVYRTANAVGVWGTFRSVGTSTGQSINVKDFGAVGDGVADDTLAIQAAVNAVPDNHGTAVTFPSATYKISAPIMVTSSNTVLEGYGAKIVGAGTLASVFIIEGAGAGVERNTTSNFNSGVSDFTTTAAHGFAIGDTLRLVSQRVSTSLDAPYADRLGGDTGSGATNNGPYFGEFLKVAAVPSTTTFQTMSQTIFNGYRTNVAQDPSSGRSRTTFQRMGMVRNVSIRGFDIDVIAGTTIRAYYAENLLIEDVRDTKRHNAGTSFAVYGSLDVTMRGCESRFTGNLAESGTLTQRTVYRAIASQNVTLDNVLAEWAGQAIDATYLRDPWLIPSINLVVRNSRMLNCLVNPLTTHPGTYMVVVDGNDFTTANGVTHPSGGYSGISIRTPKAVITNNRLRSSRRGETVGTGGNYGISFMDGAAKDFIAEGNTIEGYDRGISIADGGIAERRYGYVNGLISNNRIIDCFVGVVTSRSSASAEDPYWDVLITGNVFQNNIANSVGVWLDVQNGGSKGFHIHNNLFVFRNSFLVSEACEPVRIGHSVSEVIMANNVVRGTTIRSMWSIQGGGGAAAVNPVITDLENSVLSVSAHAYPAPTGLMTLNAQPGGGGYLGLPLGPHNINNFLGNFSLVKTTGFDINTANGYPFDGVTGYLDGKLGANGQASHAYTTMESPPRVVTRNRSTAGTWSSWT